MKKYIFLIAFISLPCLLFGQINFDDYFTEGTLRFDYIRAGNSEGNNIFFEQLKKEPHWAGNKKNIIDKFNYGHYKYLVYDAESNQLIFSRGYNSLFDEWQSTAEAKSLNRSFYETVIMPYPKNKIRLELFQRNRDGNFSKQFELIIDPKDYRIKSGKLPNYETKQIVNSGESQNKVDIVFLPDGYTKDEMEKFENDAVRFAGYFLDCSPFKENKDKFNFWIVKAPSEESGVDLPGEGIYKNTILNMTFYSLDVERYLMTPDVKSVRDLAGTVPYDNILIIANSSKYGGGAIYNYYTTFTSDNTDNAPYLIVHEFGHHFCALGDEYYTSQVSVEEYYNLNVEPYEANLTTLVNFDSKWKDMIDKDTPIPTPPTDEYKNKVGVFEGGGYVAKGVYRPVFDCTMKSRSYNNFCPVCTKAIKEMIDYYCTE
ncbi:MAG: peptidase M64 [Ignavibacteria bacterium]|nr:peptidase M64 [Ignavibacteria bacterium]